LTSFRVNYCQKETERPTSLGPSWKADSGVLQPMKSSCIELARVLLVDDDPTSRLTLKTVLQAGGYSVDAAASAAEAFGKMEESEYELVLSDLQSESPEAGLNVIRHARMMDYRPATAIITAERDSTRVGPNVLVETEDVPGLLGKIADLISVRATRRLEREMRMAAAGA
jgi:CheY-like chemotaxis protein